MELKCSSITKELLPAIRVYVAEQLSERYRMKQEEIASRLGIAQVAVSKYLNGRYSAHIRKIKEEIGGSDIVNETVEKVSHMASARAANALIDDLCARLVSD